MSEYQIVLNDGESLYVSAKKVHVKSDKTIVFFNPRGSVSEQYLYGSEVVATFNPTAYAYFCKC